MSELTISSKGLSLTEDQYDALREFFYLKSKELSENTLRGLKTDLRHFITFCEHHQHTILPASVSTIREFIRFRSEQGKKASTISRSLSAISKLHGALNTADPCRSELVRSELTIARKASPERKSQAIGIRYSHLSEWDKTVADSARLADKRDRAMMWFFYDGLLRGEEVARAQLSWVEFLDSGDGILTIPNSKTDQFGAGTEVYLSGHTCDALRDWLSAAGIESGRIFRSFTVKGALRDSMHSNGIRQVISKRGFEMGVIGATNHSTRVGGTQDLLEAGESVGRIQLAGRWKTPQMVLHYGRKQRITTGAMALLAKQQGRTKS